MRDNLIDHNHFHDFPELGLNGFECMNIGRGPQDALVPNFTLVESNLFERVLRDQEVISVKSSDNTIQFNTFKGNFGPGAREKYSLNIRQGNRNRVIGNTLRDMEFIGVRGDHTEVLGNRMIRDDGPRSNSRIRIAKGNTICDVEHWLKGNPKSNHPAARGTVVAGNVIDGNLEIGYSGGTTHHGGGPANVPASDTTLQNNVFNDLPDEGLHTGTHDAPSRATILRTKEVTHSDVGVNAPDPRDQLVEGPRITQTLRENDILGPGPFDWFADIDPDDDAVLFLVDGEVVNRETSARYGDRKNESPGFENWKNTSRYPDGTHTMTVRKETSGLETSVTVTMVAPPSS